MRSRAAVLILFSSVLFAQTARVPFVGCAQDGQAGPIDAPKGSDHTVRIGAAAAQKLAFYSTGGSFGVLAPRDWFCFGTYGSSSAELVVAPKPIQGWERLMSSPMLDVQYIEGGGSGIYEWSRVVARVFPALWPTVHGLIDNNDLPAGDFTFGPYPTDKLTVQTKRALECETPAYSEGLGTTERLKPNQDPIRTLAMLVDRNPDLLMLRIRFPRELRDLAPVIIHEFEREHK